MTATIRMGRQSWEIQLTDPSEVELMGTDWLPLPLTTAATVDQAISFVQRLPVGYTKVEVSTL